ncbi:hypothetical protein GCM10028798_34030 [Humibacter antri]
MTPSPQVVHDAYDVWKDIVLPSAGVVATLFVGIVAVVVSFRLGRRTEEREGQRQRGPFAAVAARYLAEKATNDELRDAARACGDPDAPAVEEFVTDALDCVRLLREYDPDEGHLSPSSMVLSEAQIWIRIWPHEPARARHNMADSIQRWTRWRYLAPNGHGWVDKDGRPIAPDEPRWTIPDR